MSRGWLSTLQAAKRLGVSEASVRRWSDRGLLPVQRVGKRLERRFQPEQVERIAGPARARAPPASHPPPATPAGQTVGGATHPAPPYDPGPARRRVAAPLLAAGIPPR